MNRSLSLFDLLFARGRERWGNNLFVKLGLGCLSTICLCCLCGVCFWLWVFTADTRGPLVFSPEDLPPARVGQAYEVKIAISNNDTPVGQFSVASADLPPGISLLHIDTEDSATLSGIPTQAGTYTFTLSAWCYGTNVSGQTGEKVYTIVVEE
jgi:hypothetical protein